MLILESVIWVQWFNEENIDFAIQSELVSSAFKQPNRYTEKKIKTFEQKPVKSILGGRLRRFDVYPLVIVFCKIWFKLKEKLKCKLKDENPDPSVAPALHTRKPDFSLNFREGLIFHMA